MSSKVKKCNYMDILSLIFKKSFAIYTKTHTFWEATGPIYSEDPTPMNIQIWAKQSSSIHGNGQISLLKCCRPLFSEYNLSSFVVFLTQSESTVPSQEQIFYSGQIGSTNTRLQINLFRSNRNEQSV